jgi:SPP1 gp7 family putative phage head morphogenesis protein
VDEDLHTLPTVAGARLAGTQELVQQFRTRNVNLIKTVAAEHVATVDRIVRENSGTHVKGLTAKLQETLQVSESKAKFWAVDQTLKLHADIVQTQHARLGIEEYDWKTSEDGTVRDDHDKLKNKRYRYDNPPVTNASEVAKGRPARHCNPGKDYRCRCHADPVLPTAESLRAKKQVVAPVQQQPAPAPQSAPRPVPHPAQAKTQVRELFQSVQATVPQQTVDRIVGGLNSKDAAILRANPATELRMGSTLAEGKNYSGMYDQPTDTIFIKADHAIEEFPSFRGKFRPGKSWSVAVAQANPEAAAAASLTHEIAHRIQHQAKGSAVNLEVAKAFRNGKAIGNPITNYAKTNSQEYFAETYSAYRYYPDALLRHDPLGYQMIVNVLRILELA